MLLSKCHITYQDIIFCCDTQEQDISFDLRRYRSIWGMQIVSSRRDRAPPPFFWKDPERDVDRLVSSI